MTLSLTLVNGTNSPIDPIRLEFRRKNSSIKLIATCKADVKNSIDVMKHATSDACKQFYKQQGLFYSNSNLQTEININPPKKIKINVKENILETTEKTDSY